MPTNNVNSLKDVKISRSIFQNITLIKAVYLYTFSRSKQNVTDLDHLNNQSPNAFGYFGGKQSNLTCGECTK